MALPRGALPKSPRDPGATGHLVDRPFPKVRAFGRVNRIPDLRASQKSEDPHGVRPVSADVGLVHPKSPRIGAAQTVRMVDPACPGRTFRSQKSEPDIRPGARFGRWHPKSPKGSGIGWIRSTTTCRGIPKVRARMSVPPPSSDFGVPKVRKGGARVAYRGWFFGLLGCAGPLPRVTSL
jgi:hypothetical protein